MFNFPILTLTKHHHKVVNNVSRSHPHPHCPIPEPQMSLWSHCSVLNLVNICAPTSPTPPCYQILLCCPTMRKYWRTLGHHCSQGTMGRCESHCLEWSEERREHLSSLTYRGRVNTAGGSMYQLPSYQPGPAWVRLFITHFTPLRRSQPQSVSSVISTLHWEL